MTVDLAALVSSRICHDLISPIGAISNGVELISLTAAQDTAEMSLISQSVEAANARIRFFRIAFGTATPGQSVSRSEIGGILDAMTATGRTRLAWQVPTNPDRATARLVFLALLCLETAMPGGGDVTVTEQDNRWTLDASAPRIALDPALWGPLTGDGTLPDLAPAQVQFALIREALAMSQRHLTMTTGDGLVMLRF